MPVREFNDGVKEVVTRFVVSHDGLSNSEAEQQISAICQVMLRGLLSETYRRTEVTRAHRYTESEPWRDECLCASIQLRLQHVLDEARPVRHRIALLEIREFAPASTAFVERIIELVGFGVG
jgi:hypothetical protein